MRATTATASASRIANDAFVDETPGALATASLRASAVTCGTVAVMEAASAFGLTPDDGITATAEGSTMVASGFAALRRVVNVSKLTNRLGCTLNWLCPV